MVLVAEHLIAPEVDALGLYRAFAAVYLDLDAFDSPSLEHYFPSLPRGDAVRAALGEDVDAASLLARARPVGSAATRVESPPDEFGEALASSAAEASPSS